MTTLIKNIKTLVQATNNTPSIARGKAMQELSLLHDAYVLIENDQIADYGIMDLCPERADQIIDASGRMVLPTWCDS
ncbi:MAG: imidazolonepropionase, partial [Aureispira sp.]|nr:imidazolonepropionase [Aureispira sp.]